MCWTARCGLVPCCQQNWWKGCSANDCSHMSPSLPFRRAHVERGPASGVAPSRSAVAILHCALCATSVGDLCMAVQHVPVPGPPALSTMACCSGDISLCGFAASTASAASEIVCLCLSHTCCHATRPSRHILFCNQRHAILTRPLHLTRFPNQNKDTSHTPGQLLFCSSSSRSLPPQTDCWVALARV